MIEDKEEDSLHKHYGKCQLRLFPVLTRQFYTSPRHPLDASLRLVKLEFTKPSVRQHLLSAQPPLQPNSQAAGPPVYFQRSATEISASKKCRRETEHTLHCHKVWSVFWTTKQQLEKTTGMSVKSLTIHGTQPHAAETIPVLKIRKTI